MSRLCVAILWHMHQPCYRTPGNRAFRLPWVRLHALKDYFDMPQALAGHPGVHATFNLVPSLLDQLVSYADGSASDIHLDLTAAPAGDLSEQQRCQTLRDFFMANWQTMIRPHPRYWELLEKRGFNFREADLPRIARRFTEADLRDLQVWFTLGWIDLLHFELRPVLRELQEKGRGFSEQDKAILLGQQLEIIRSIIPAYRQAWEDGRIEVSTTPYYHPILPLLCDSDSARQCMPNAALPPKFAYPGDAQAQIERGIAYIEKLFGRRPAGIWPSEGSVSEAAYGLIAATGARWLATDEGILSSSLSLPARAGLRQRCRPYILGDAGSPSIFFRDQQLSDLIGFSYAGWKPDDAAQDMVHRLEQAASALGADAGRHIVPVILDGENCWEFYPNDGREFLERLYTRLEASAQLRCCTFSEFLDAPHETGELRRLAPGSWINRDFGIWIGQDEDNKAWQLLLSARQEIERREAALDNTTRDEVLEELYAAEGSDWCWWYGGTFSSENLADFDDLFRLHLQRIYKLLGLEIPQELYQPIARERIIEQLLQEPIDLLSPAIDGRVTSFYEWTGAGVYNVMHEGGTMHRSQSLLRTIHYGFDLQHLYVRLDGSDHLLDPVKLPELSVVLDIRKPAAMKLTVPIDGKLQQNGTAGALDQLIEVKVPFALITAEKQATIEFYVSLHSNGQELERHPVNQPIVVKIPDKSFIAKNWQA